jgi:hypothetical protein
MTPRSRLTCLLWTSSRRAHRPQSTGAHYGSVLGAASPRFTETHTSGSTLKVSNFNITIPQPDVPTVIGSKTFYVLPPEAAPLLDPSTDPRHTNTSTIPIPVSSLFPNSSQELQGIDDIPPRIINRSREKLEEAFKLPGASTVSLQAGESVLVPEGWWHSAEGGDTAGIGVGAWFR